MTIRVRPEHYFFMCLACRVSGNLPGVLARMVDAHALTLPKNEAAIHAYKLEELKKIQEMFPYPENRVPPPAVKK